MDKINIKKVAVIGSGIMGSRIACHLSNIGLSVILLDICPTELNEKEKKLKDTLKKLGEINIQHNEELDKVAILKDQKNQLEIEKKQITTSLQSLEEENLKLRSQINELKKDYETSKRKEKEIQYSKAIYENDKVINAEKFKFQKKENILTASENVTVLDKTKDFFMKTTFLTYNKNFEK